ncbi:hypothetical protein [Candidimonas sp. SYP-B2681]|nr:hypothetical protein [Candidimonas sp. SYP-B2681]
MTSDLPTDVTLSRDIDALRERFTQTQELYRKSARCCFSGMA